MSQVPVPFIFACWRLRSVGPGMVCWFVRFVCSVSDRSYKYTCVPKEELLAWYIANINYSFLLFQCVFFACLWVWSWVIITLTSAISVVRFLLSLLWLSYEWFTYAYVFTYNSIYYASENNTCFGSTRQEKIYLRTDLNNNTTTLLLQAIDYVVRDKH